MKLFQSEGMLSFFSSLTVPWIKNKAPSDELDLFLFHRLSTLAPTHAQTGEVNVEDDSIVRRILNAYKHATSDAMNLGTSMWQTIFDHRHLDIHNTFLRGSFEEAAKILRDPSHTDLFWGIDNLSKSLVSQITGQREAFNEAARCLDGLVRFAQAIAAVKMNYLETKVRIPSLRANPVIEKIEQTLGQQIVFPNPYPYEPGLETMRGVCSYRAPQSLYQAWKAKQLLKGISSPRVAEIGAGVGRTAYYAQMFGIEDYTIVDLPIVSAASGYFLSRTLGEDRVQLSGEEMPDSNQRVKFVLPSQFLKSLQEYDLIINVDSFTEMDINVARAYWKHIQSHAKIFLSINHEFNPFSVRDLMTESTGPIDIERTAYWMRQGYVEEVIRCLN